MFVGSPVSAVSTAGEINGYRSIWRLF